MHAHTHARARAHTHTATSTFTQLLSSEDHSGTEFKFSVALRPRRPLGLLGTGSPGRPPRLLTQLLSSVRAILLPLLLLTTLLWHHIL